jgi:hypothetical protein
MKHNLETLATFGETMYGRDWQSPMARALGVADRTIRRWVAGDTSIDPSIWADLPELCAERAKHFEEQARACKSLASRCAYQSVGSTSNP